MHFRFCLHGSYYQLCVQLLSNMSARNLTNEFLGENPKKNGLSSAYRNWLHVIGLLTLCAYHAGSLIIAVTINAYICIKWYLLFPLSRAIRRPFSPIQPFGELRRCSKNKKCKYYLLVLCWHLLIQLPLGGFCMG